MTCFGGGGLLGSREYVGGLVGWLVFLLNQLGGNGYLKQCLEGHLQVWLLLSCI